MTRREVQKFANTDRILIACINPVGVTADELATLSGVASIDAYVAIGRLLRDGYMRRPSIGDAGLLIRTDAGRDRAAQLCSRRYDEAMAAFVNSY